MFQVKIRTEYIVDVFYKKIIIFKIKKYAKIDCDASRQPYMPRLQRREELEGIA